MTEKTLSSSIFHFLRWVARACKPVSQFFLGWTFTHMSFIIPTQRLYESDRLIAFYHPKPSHKVHILLTPKKSIPNLEALSPEQDQEFLGELFAAVQQLVAQMDLGSSGYRLVTNGGQYQEIPQLHFHLIADGPAS